MTIELVQQSRVDELQNYLREIEALEKLADEIKTELKATGLAEVLGTHVKAVISVSNRSTVDHKSVYAVYKITPEMLAPYTTTKSVTSLTVKPL